MEILKLFGPAILPQNSVEQAIFYHIVNFIPSGHNFLHFVSYSKIYNTSHKNRHTSFSVILIPMFFEFGAAGLRHVLI